MQINSGRDLRAAASILARAFVMLGAWPLSSSATQTISPSVSAPVVTAPIDAETQLRDEITSKVKLAWSKADFADLDSIAEGYVQGRQRPVVPEPLAMDNSAINALSRGTR